jgi:hypothetical protein
VRKEQWHLSLKNHIANYSILTIYLTGALILN